MTETYRPSGDEVDAFNEELREYARDPDFRAHAAEGVRLLALAHWPGPQRACPHPESRR